MFEKMTRGYKMVDRPVSNETINETFGLLFCPLVDFPEDLTDCSTENPSKCIRCSYRGTYFSGASIHDYRSFALCFYYFLWIAVILVSMFGMLGNILIFKVLRRRKSVGSFDSLLMVLGFCDLFSSVMSIVASTGSMAYYGNWFGRGLITMYFYSVSLYSVVFSRSCSTFMTVLITIERYFMITFPLRATTWFTPRRTKVLAGITLLIAVLLNYPRFAGICVDGNNHQDVPSLEFLEYVLRPTAQARFWYVTLNAIHNQIDFWVPLPVLILFNFLSYLKVLQLSKKRKEMNLNQKHNIRAVKMFLPVVIVYTLTNMEPIINYLVIQFTRTVYRELYMLMFLSIAVNSAVNMPIYYYCSPAFKSEAITYLRNCGGGKLNTMFPMQSSKVITTNGSDSGFPDGQKSASSGV